MVLGVSGGIAAYKALDLCRRLGDLGAIVSPVLTPDALRFVGALSFSALAAQPALTSMWDGPVSPHTTLGQGADLVIVAPATARTIAAYTHGLADDVLINTLLATRAPVVVCPAMHTEMWEHPSTQDNLAVLRRRGVTVVDPGVGYLASGDQGAGRLADTAAIVVAAESILGSVRDMTGLRVLVTAGGTREAIDPVRFIGNRSSGKQGFAFVDECAGRGAVVTVVTTVNRPVPAGVTVVTVESADQMEAAVADHCGAAHIIVMAAAVADFRPVHAAAAKIKKDPSTTDAPTITLERTPDILAGLGAAKPVGQILIGFAAETGDVAHYAQDKLARKGADMIVANDVSLPGRGFDTETNEVIIFTSSGGVHHVELADKRAVARAVINLALAAIGTDIERTVARRHGG